MQQSPDDERPQDPSDESRAADDAEPYVHDWSRPSGYQHDDFDGEANPIGLPPPDKAWSRPPATPSENDGTDEPPPAWMTTPRPATTSVVEVPAPEPEQPEERRPERPPLPRRPVVQPRGQSARIPLLVLVFGAGLLLYLAVEPTKDWLLLVLVGLTALGTDGVLRGHPRLAGSDIAATVPLLFLPTLMALAAGLFLEDALHGYLVVPGAIAASALMGSVLYAEQISVDGDSEAYASARFVVNLGTYLTAFALYSVVYSFDVALVPASICVGLVSLLLAVEILSEAEADPMRVLVFAGVVGLIVAEARWALYFLPLESYLAGMFLLLVFYLTSGVVQHHLNDDLDRPVVAEFVLIALVGVIIVTLGRIFESGA